MKSQPQSVGREVHNVIQKCNHGLGFTFCFLKVAKLRRRSDESRGTSEKTGSLPRYLCPPGSIIPSSDGTRVSTSTIMKHDSCGGRGVVPVARVEARTARTPQEGHKKVPDPGKKSASI